MPVLERSGFSTTAFAGIRDLLVKQARFGAKIKSVVQTKDKMSRMHALSVPVENALQHWILDLLNFLPCLFFVIFVPLC